LFKKFNLALSKTALIVLSMIFYLVSSISTDAGNQQAYVASMFVGGPFVRAGTTLQIL